MARGGAVLAAAVLCCLAAAAVPAAAQTSPAVKTALLAIYAAAGGPGWRDNTGWRDASDPCRGVGLPPGAPWYGLTCDESSEIQEIRLVNNSLVGTFPDEIKAFFELRLIDVRLNPGLSGPLPTMMNLGHVHTVAFDKNAFNGTIPGHYLTRTSLVSLSLSDNQLTGSVPAAATPLPKLKYLYLDRNQLTGAIPPSLNEQTLPILLELGLAQNALTGTIPEGWCRMQSVRSLTVAFNALSGSIPECLWNMTALESLILSGNAFSGTLPASLGAIPQLRSLAAYSNALSGPLPPELADAPHLGVINLYENALSGPIPSAWGRMVNLTILQLTSNRLGGFLPEALGDLKRLQQLKLADNGFWGWAPAFLESPNPGLTVDLADTQLWCPMPTWASVADFECVPIDLRTVDPERLPHDRNTNITVTGSAFVPQENVRCRVTTEDGTTVTSVNITYSDSRTLSCILPPHDPADLLLSLAYGDTLISSNIIKIKYYYRLDFWAIFFAYSWIFVSVGVCAVLLTVCLGARRYHSRTAVDPNRPADTHVGIEMYFGDGKRRKR